MPNLERPLFTESWFSRSVFAGLSAALHGDRHEVLAREGAFMSALVIELLERQRDGSLFNPGLYKFYAFCQQNLQRSNSQILQDLWALYMLGEKREGFFVEFGACDGIKLSNTLLLARDYAWRGILAEPDKFWHRDLAKNRSEANIDHRCVAPKSGDKIKFAHVPSMPELSRMVEIAPNDIHERSGNRAIVEEIEVDTVSLMDLLRTHEAPREIDYLSVDTEGSELEILSAVDFDAYRFRLISVEHAGDAAKRDAIKGLLEGHGYLRWRPELTRWDDWYVAN